MEDNRLIPMPSRLLTQETGLFRGKLRILRVAMRLELDDEQRELFDIFKVGCRSL